MEKKRTKADVTQTKKASPKAKDPKAEILRLGKVRDLTLGAGRQYVDGRKDSERQ